MTEADKRRVSRCFAIGAAAVAVPVLLALLLSLVPGWQAALANRPTLNLLVSAGAQYLPFWLLGLWVGGKNQPLPQGTEKPWRLLPWLPLLLALTYAGNALGQWLAGLLGLGEADSLQENLWVRLGVVCLLAPLAEEWFYRGKLLPGFLPLGKRRALLSSALLFALSHGSLPAFCYALLAGLGLGWIALASGSWRVSFLFHVLLNLVGFLPELVSLPGEGLVILSLALGLIACPFALPPLWKAWKEKGLLPVSEVFCQPGLWLSVALFLLKLQ